MTVYCDVDGTLLDSNARHVTLLRDLLQQKGYEWPVAAPDYMAYKADGHNTRSWLKLAGFSQEEACDLAGQWQAQIETPFYLNLDKPYPDAVPFLQELKRLHMRVVLISARKNAEMLRAMLQDLGVLPLVDELLVVSPLHAAEEKAARLQPSVVPGDIMVGDTEADFLAAQQLGIPCYLLNRGFRSEGYWQQQGVASFHDLPEVLKAITKANKED